MSNTVETYRISFSRDITPKAVSKHKEQHAEELLNLVRKQEALNLIPQFEKTWTIKFKGLVCRIFSDQNAYALEINPEIFDQFSDDEKAFVILREIEKMRLGLVEPLKAPELTPEQELELDEHASSIVGVEVSKSVIEKLKDYAEKNKDS